jgi:hypothetical protein
MSGQANKFYKKMKKTETINQLVWLTIFAISMGFLEAAVVVYLRDLYYPGGFYFPLVMNTNPHFIILEWLREISTIVMLVSIGMLASKGLIQRLSYFIFSFAIWDISYYVWLKVVLGWPMSFLTWDLLFLIPVPWIGPVLAPIICSLTMIVLTFSILHLKRKNPSIRIDLREWLLFLAGTFVIFVSFIWDYSKIVIEGGFAKDFFHLGSNIEFQRMVSHYVPNHYNWGMFIFGEALILLALALLYRKAKPSNK